jgi:hypothetical protein
MAFVASMIRKPLFMTFWTRCGLSLETTWRMVLSACPWGLGVMMPCEAIGSRLPYDDVIVACYRMW